MHSNEFRRARGTKGNKTKNGSQIKYYVETRPSPGQRNIETSIQPEHHQSGTFGESNKMEWEPAVVLPVSPPARMSFGSAGAYKLQVLKNAEIRNISACLSRTKLSPHHSRASPHSSKLYPENPKVSFLSPAPMSKSKTDKRSSVTGPLDYKDFARNPFGSPLDRRAITQNIGPGEQAKYLLNFIKSKRADLKCVESELDACMTEIQIGIRDAEQVCFKLEVEPETVAEDINGAITQMQKLEYLVSISCRSFKKLDLWDATLWNYLHSYDKASAGFHTTVDELLKFVMENIFEISRQIGNK